MKKNKKTMQTVASRMKEADCACLSKIKSKLKARDEEVPWISVDTSGINATCRAELTDWMKAVGYEVQGGDKILKVTVPRDRDWRRLIMRLEELPKVTFSWPGGYLEDGLFFNYLRRPNARFSRYCRETGQFPTMTVFENWSGITQMRTRAKSEKQPATKK
jgi:hypothetical protein